MLNDWKESWEYLYCALDLVRKPVGIRLLSDEREYLDADAKSLLKPINYCQMVMAASRGNRIKAKSEDFLCRSGARCLGIDPTDALNSHGENWARLGLYDSPELSADIRASLTYSTESKFGLIAAPAENYGESPDVVLIVTDPYNCMRIVQGYAYHFGMPESVRMIGNQAVCLECTARPYVTGDINLSLLCIGTRHQAGWKNDEMAVGIPGARFIQVVDGIVSTIDQMESDSNKELIAAKFKERGIDRPIRFHYNYYMDC